ncbi:MAG TPA: hypothetical protein VG028_12935 [Terriglobia bacterium]|nr:hypothetical protein [Terriglobia bacterium]
MMSSKIERARFSRPVSIGGGAAAVVLVALLTWVDLSAQLNSRQPIPSPDGKYFAYFDSTDVPRMVSRGSEELIISTVRGQEVARFVMMAGTISWSNAGDLAVVNANYNYAALIANSDGRFLPVKYLRYAHAAPLWSTDGTKIAYVPWQSDGGGISIYDFLQTRRAAVPFPAGFRFERPLPLFWSPGSGLLFFLNGVGPAVVLDRVEIQSGNLQQLARGEQSWRISPLERPRLSPDGTKIYLPPPLHSVIDAQTGQSVWTLPPPSKVSWFLWSEDGHQIYYQRGESSDAIVAHDLTESTDHLILDHAEPGGFFSADGESYFYRVDLLRPPFGAWQSIRDWLKLQWGWQQEDVAGRSSTPMGRALLRPEVQTRDGLISMSRDDYMRVRYGLYEPQSRKFSKFVFPTEGEDLFRSMRLQAITLLGALLYGALAFYMLRMPQSSPSRALYILALILMVLFASLNANYTVIDFFHGSRWNLVGAILTAKVMTVTSFRFALLQGQLICLILALAILPPSFLHFVFVFPEGNQFLADRTKLKLVLYAAECLPLLGTLWAFNVSGESMASFPILPWVYYIAGFVIPLSTLFAFLHHHFHPPACGAPKQFRWAIMAMAAPLAALAGLELLHIF